MQKNTATEPLKDWHCADVVAALKRVGWTVRSLSRANKLSEYTLYTALDRSYPKGEKIIAAALGLESKDIWPEREAKRNFKPALLYEPPFSL